MQSQTTLSAGDLAFTAYDATKTVTDDKFSFVLLTNISSGTDIYFTDRGYSGSSWQSVTATTEGTIKWTSGTALTAGTEVMIKSLSATVNSVTNGTISVVAGNTSGLSLSHPSGDQIIAFQGGAGDPSATGVTFIAGIHWNYCPNGYYAVYTDDAGWDNIGNPSSCVLGPNASNIPPGLTGGTNAFWIGFYKPTAPAVDIRNYTKGQFNGAGAPFASMAALRTAIMNRNNWIPVRSDDTETSITIPTGYTYISSGPSISSHPSNKTVCVSSNTTFSVTASGASSYQWQVDAGSGFNNISNTGVYSGSSSSTLTITGAAAGMNGYLYRCLVIGSGTVNSNSATLTVTTPAAFTVTGGGSFCSGGSGVAIGLSGSASGVSYQLYNGASTSGSPVTGTGSTITFGNKTSAGTYTVVATDVNSCTRTMTGSATVTVNPLPTITLGTSPSVILGATNANLPYTATTNSPATYTITWSATALSAGFTNISTPASLPASPISIIVPASAPSNTYVAAIRVQNSTCNSSSVIFTVTVAAAPAPAITAHPANKTVCAGGNTSFSITATDATSYQWQVDQGSGFTNVSNNAPYSGATTATLTLTGIVTGLNGYQYRCVTSNESGNATSNAGILTVSNISTTTSQTNVSCNSGSNGTATVFPSGGISPYTYSWSPSGGTAATATGLAAGSYIVTITDNNSCQTTQTFAITQPTALSASTSKTDVSCNGGSNGTATVSVTGGTPAYTYSWSPSGGTAATATGLAAGTYTCTITDANTCQITRSFTITQATALAATTSKTNVSCNGGSNGTATVSVTGGTPSYTYSWAPGGGTAATATGLAAGTYTCTVTDANACQITRSFTITQPTALAATTSKTDVSCNGGSNGTATVSVTGGTPAYTYSWAPSGGTAATATGLAAGTYICTVTDANACQITRSFTVTQPTALSATVISQTNVACNGGSNGSASVSVTGGTPAYTYSWAPSGGTAATATGLAAGTYTCTITDANTCITTKSVTISQPSALSVSGSQTNVSCNGGNNGSASVTVTGGTGSYTYSWAPSGGTAATATGLAAGTYTCTITDANSCQVTKSFTITQPVLPTASATPAASTICSGSTTNIVLTSVPSGASFTWTVSSVSGNISGASLGSGTTIEQTLIGNGVINYTVSYTNGTCSGSPVTIPVTVNALTAITGEPESKFIEEYETTSFAVTADHAGSYEWQVNDGGGFVNVSNDEMYVGAQTNELTITGSTESMNGYLYRCIVSGNCSPVTSANATLNVKIRTPQHITFALTSQVIYGVDDFSPEGVSDAGLEITYTSSNTAIAEIINGKIHIKQAGEVTFTASQAGNDDYKPATSVTQLLTISKKDITVMLNVSPAITKSYDGNTGATLAAQNYTLNGVVGEDDVYVTGEAQYDDSKAGNNKHITANNFILNGEQKNNYNLITSSAGVNGSISKKEISITINSAPAITKTYNGNTAATLSGANYTISGIEGEDEVNVTGTATYEDKHAGTDKNITVNNFVLQGADKDNYELVTVSAATSGTITAKPITVTIVTEPLISKMYDGNATAAIAEENFVLHDIEEGDKVTVTAEAMYDSRQAGQGKAITLNGFVLGGDDKNNYSLETTSAATTGEITRKQLNVTINNSKAISKQYDGNTTATIAAENYTVEGIVGDDMVQLNNPETGEYDTKHGGTNKKITVEGLIISGEDADNYELGSAIASGEVGTITKKEIVVTAASQTKVYGKADPVFSYTAEGKLEEDALPGVLSRAGGKHAGEYEINIGSLSGGDDYEITEFNGAVLTVTPAPLMIKADNKTKKQGTANPVLTFTYDGLVEGDVATDLDTLPVAVTDAVKASPIGTYDIEAKGAASHDYTISYEEGKLTVTPSGDESYSMKVWTSSPDVIQVRIFSAVAQKATITLYTEVGQKVIIQQKQLNAGINSYSIHAGNLASSTYVLGVMAEKFKDAQKVRVK